MNPSPSSGFHRPRRRHSCPGATPGEGTALPNRSSPFVFPDEESLKIVRRNLTAVTVGALQDELARRDRWSMIELKASSRWALRLLEVLSTGGPPLRQPRTVQCLVLDEPSEAACLWLAHWLQRAAAAVASDHRSTTTTTKNNTSGEEDSWTHLEHLVWNRATITFRVAMGIQQALAEQAQAGGRGLRRLTVLGGVFEGGTRAVRALADGLGYHQNGLQRLSFRSCHLEDEEIALLVRALEGHPTLEELNIGTNFCQEAGILALASLLTSGAMPSNNNAIEDTTNDAVPEPNNSESTATNPSSSPPSSPPSSLQSSSSSSSRITNGASVLRKLDLSCQDVWDDREYFIHLASALSNPSCAQSLVELNLSSNFLMDDQFVWLLLALRDNPRLFLRRLDLTANQITDVGLSACAKILPLLQHLQSLQLEHNRYTSQGVGAVAEGLRHNTSLIELGLDHAFGDDDLVPGTSTLLWYYLALNRGGRYCKGLPDLPLGLWPVLLAKVPDRLLDQQASAVGITPSDIYFDLLHGPALLERG